MLRCALGALLALVLAAPPAFAQFTRQFPATALRGELLFGQPPQAELNGAPVRLAPGARIRGDNNLLQMSGALIGQAHVVHYTVDPYGLIMDVWILSQAERAKRLWPSNAREAASWSFDPVAQTWTRR